MIQVKVWETHEKNSNVLNYLGALSLNGLNVFDFDLSSVNISKVTVEVEPSSTDEDMSLNMGVCFLPYSFECDVNTLGELKHLEGKNYLEFTRWVLEKGLVEENPIASLDMSDEEYKAVMGAAMKSRDLYEKACNSGSKLKLLHHYRECITPQGAGVQTLIKVFGDTGTLVEVRVSTHDGDDLVMYFTEGNATPEELVSYPDEALAVIAHPDMYPYEKGGMTTYTFRE